MGNSYAMRNVQYDNDVKYVAHKAKQEFCEEKTMWKTRKR